MQTLIQTVHRVTTIGAQIGCWVGDFLECFLNKIGLKLSEKTTWIASLRFAKTAGQAASLRGGTTKQSRVRVTIS